MKALIKLAILTIGIGIISTGCATKGDVSNLQTQIDGQNYQIDGVRKTADEALGTARTADHKATRALSLLDQRRSHRSHSLHRRHTRHCPK